MKEDYSKTTISGPNMEGSRYRELEYLYGRLFGTQIKNFVSSDWNVISEIADNLSLL